jgi:AcrR family transcriptional regulator
MGISERREREKAERRRAILDCARDLILLHGVHYVSMEDIAHKAELSKATVYLYFSSKEVLFNEICEDAARIFLEHLKPFLEKGASGITALKYFWRGYVEMFGNSDDMIIVFQVHNFLNPGMPLVSLEEQSKSSYVDAILASMKNIIDQCKADGLFDPALDSVKATRLLLSMFSITVESAARVPHEIRKSPAIIDELKSAFQVIIRGFAKEGVDRSCLDFTGF